MAYSTHIHITGQLSPLHTWWRRIILSWPPEAVRVTYRWWHWLQNYYSTVTGKLHISSHKWLSVTTHSSSETTKYSCSWFSSAPPLACMHLRNLKKVMDQLTGTTIILRVVSLIVYINLILNRTYINLSRLYRNRRSPIWNALQGMKTPLYHVTKRPLNFHQLPIISIHFNHVFITGSPSQICF